MTQSNQNFTKQNKENEIKANSSTIIINKELDRENERIQL